VLGNSLATMLTCLSIFTEIYYGENCGRAEHVNSILFWSMAWQDVLDVYNAVHIVSVHLVNMSISCCTTSSTHRKPENPYADVDNRTSA